MVSFTVSPVFVVNEMPAIQKLTCVMLLWQYNPKMTAVTYLWPLLLIRQSPPLPQAHILLLLNVPALTSSPLKDKVHVASHELMKSFDHRKHNIPCTGYRSVHNARWSAFSLICSGCLSDSHTNHMQQR